MNVRRSESGAVLAMMLIVILVGAAITAGWVAVMSAEARYVETFADAAKRRIAVGNATGLARQHLLTNFLTKRLTNEAAVTADVGDGWGSITIPGVSVTPPAPPLVPLDSVTTADGWNHFNPANGDGYAVTVPVEISAGGSTGTRYFLARSRSSALAGSVLISNKPYLSPAATVSVGSLAVGGQSLLWQPNSPNGYSLTTESFNAPSLPIPTLSLMNSAGTSLAVSNFPFVPLTSGDVGGVASFDGKMDAIANGSGTNSLAVKAAGAVSITGLSGTTANGVTSDGAGTVTINLTHPELDNVVIVGETNRIVFEGQSNLAQETYAGNQIAVLVVVIQPVGQPTDPSTGLPMDLANVDFKLTNNRKFVFGIWKASGIDPVNFNFLQAGKWRGIFSLENCAATINVPGSKNLQGGIQSDRSITTVGGTLAITTEPDPKLLDRLTTRDGWIEVFTRPINVPPSP